MQPGSPPPLAMTFPTGSRKPLWPYWAVLLSGFLLTAGLLLPLGPFLLTLAGLYRVAGGVLELEWWYQIADGLEAVGFLSAFVGIAWALRAPAAASSKITWRTFLVVVVGGVFVAAGVVVSSLGTLYLFLYPVLGPFYLANILEIAGRILQAAGFLLAFAGIAQALRPRLEPGSAAPAALQSP